MKVERVASQLFKGLKFDEGAKLSRKVCCLNYGFIENRTHKNINCLLGNYDMSCLFYIERPVDKYGANHTRTG